MNRITWLGHSTVLVDVEGARLLTDPVLRRRVAHLVRERAVPAKDVRGVDTVLLSHMHYDHLDIPSLESLGRDLPIVVPRGGGALLRKRGFRAVTEVEVGDELQVGALRVRTVHADHEGKRRPLGPGERAVGYVVEGGGHGIYFAGDTDLFDGMREIAADIALIPVSGWGPRVPEGHLDPARAAEALTMLQAKVAVPIHWGTYHVVGRPGSPDAAREFEEAATRVAPQVEVEVLPVGGTLELS